MRLEDEIQQDIRLEAPKLNVTLFRNNNGAFTDSTGRNIRFGLGNDSARVSENFKSSDLIGFTLVVVTPEMLGTVVPIFTAIEVKKEGWQFKFAEKRAVAQKKLYRIYFSRKRIRGFC